MKSKAKICLILLILSVFNVSSVRAPPETQTIHITATSDDGFVTEAGIGFDTSLVTVLDPNMDIRSFLVFRDIEINFWEPLTNATLRLHTSNTLTFEADSKVTIYGVRQSNFNGFGGPSSVISAPVTFASVVFNTSQFYGGAWHDIDVSAIIRELVSNPNWDGEGTDGTGATDHIGFVIYGDDGYETRYFYDYSVGNGLEAQLVIHWNHAPTPPSVGAPSPYNDTSVYNWEFVNTTRGFDIWRVDALGAPEFQYLMIDAGSDAYYHNSSTGTGGARLIGRTWLTAEDGGATSPIISLDPWTLVLGDPGSMHVYISDDEFLTNTSYDPNNEYNLAAFSGNIGSIAVDRQISNLFHLVYTSVTPAHVANYNVVYTNFTLDTVTGIPTFAPSYTNITQLGSTQYYPVIHVQENGSLHVVWHGKDGNAENQIWYRRRHENGTWLGKVRVSDTDVGGQPHNYPDVVANSETGVALIVWEFDRTDTYWDVVFTNNTDDADRTANTGVVPSIVMDRQRNEALMVWSSALGQPAVVYFQNKTISNSTAWSANKQVSPGAQKHFKPDIGIETQNGTIQTVWENDWNARTSGNFWNILTDPVPGATTTSTEHSRHTFIEEEFSLAVFNTTYFVAWENGTLVDNVTCATEECAIIKIDQILGTDPEDPAPPGQDWEVTGPFTRFRTRLYIWMIGIFLIFGPVFSFAYRRPSGYAFVIGLFIMLVGLGFMIAAGSV